MQFKSSIRTFSRTFKLYTKEPSKVNAPQFVVGADNGFLPRQEPLAVLPNEFKELEELLQKMPLQLKDGSPGLLSKGEFGKTVLAKLPLYDVSKINDTRLLTALFRDYTFAVSSYLLEPCDIMHRKRGEYGLGRNRLPANLAVPLVTVSSKLGAKPFMEYAQSYALYNYKKLDPKGGLNYENLELIRTSSGLPAEHGFILVHVAMVAHTGKQVKSIAGALEAIKAQNRSSFNTELKNLLDAMKKMNAVMDSMWTNSSPNDYLKFRTFIMGTKNQPMFPNGVVYEGVSEEPKFYRGESGANDSIIPSTDNFLEITSQMPQNPLTEILRDFRSYRPVHHNEWLNWVETEAKQLCVRKYSEQDPSSSILYLALLDQVREFRNRHWSFTKEYIIKHSNHPVATGGSPIVTWLPNQLGVVLNMMMETGKRMPIVELNPQDYNLAQELIKRAETQKRILDREVLNLSKKFK